MKHKTCKPGAAYRPLGMHGRGDGFCRAWPVPRATFARRPGTSGRDSQLCFGRFLAFANTPAGVNLNEGRFLAFAGNSTIVEKFTEGRFLAFAANATIVANLTEGRFRSYWKRTSEHGSSNERVRFKAMLDLMQTERAPAAGRADKSARWRRLSCQGRAACDHALTEAGFDGGIPRTRATALTPIACSTVAILCHRSDRPIT
jgi:hypothetical protein